MSKTIKNNKEKYIIKLYQLLDQEPDKERVWHAHDLIFGINEQLPKTIRLCNPAQLGSVLRYQKRFCLLKRINQHGGFRNCLYTFKEKHT